MREMFTYDNVLFSDVKIIMLENDREGFGSDLLFKDWLDIHLQGMNASVDQQEYQEWKRGRQYDKF